MKVKTSITLSENVVLQMDQLLEGHGNRSAFIEEAIKHYVVEVARNRRDAKDLQILNEQADQLNAEASEVLAYQVEL